MKISPLDVEIAQHLSQGLIYKEVVQKIPYIGSHKTIEGRVARLKEKLNAKSLFHLAVILKEKQII